MPRRATTPMRSSTPGRPSMTEMTGNLARNAVVRLIALGDVKAASKV